MIAENRWRLPVRVSPLWAESLRGYLMRVAEANDLSSADRLLLDAVGESRCPITAKRALVLADYCRCDVPEFFQLFGVEGRSVSRERQWHLAGEAITKDYFVRPSRPSVCPQCLREHSYLKGQWEITMYVACPLHEVLLLSVCPSCKRAISAHRARLDRCNCGFVFAEAGSVAATRQAIWVASLIDKCVIAAAIDTPTTNVASVQTAERLAQLSLDALFKTFWFLGHYLSAALPEAVGRTRPDACTVLQLIQRTIGVLDGWPGSFLDILHTRASRLQHAKFQHPEVALMPLRNYLEHELTDEGHTYIHAAYDRFIRDAWRNRAYCTYRKNRIAQLELF